VWVNFAEPFVVEMAGRAGYDFVVLDAQHGLISEHDLLRMIQATEASGARCVVRAADADLGRIGRLLDFGVDAVIVPMIESLAHAKAVAEAGQYPPRGVRSYGPTRVSLRGDDYFRKAGDHVCILPMIELASALPDIEEIAALPDVAGLFVGPSDLSIGLGLYPQRDQADPRFVAAIDRVLKACRAHGKLAGIQGDLSVSEKRFRQGFNFVTVAMDSSDLKTSFRNTLARARQEAEAAPKS
jgi:4-hydroxy-2-oxoheptanedioate aldolase